MDDGKITSAERIEVGSLRFINEEFGFSEEFENPFQQIDAFVELVNQTNTEFTSIKLKFTGELNKEQHEQLEQIIATLKEKSKNLEIIEQYFTNVEITHSDPLFDSLSNAINEKEGFDENVKKRALILLKANLRRWQ